MSFSFGSRCQTHLTNLESQSGTCPSILHTINAASKGAFLTITHFGSGGGPAGLSLAATIARFNDATAPVAFDIYEAQPVIGTVGAGINVYPRTRQMLERLNLMGKLAGEIGAEEGQEGMPFQVPLDLTFF